MSKSFQQDSHHITLSWQLYLFFATFFKGNKGMKSAFPKKDVLKGLSAEGVFPFVGVQSSLNKATFIYRVPMLSQFFSLLFVWIHSFHFSRKHTEPYWYLNAFCKRTKFNKQGFWATKPRLTVFVPCYNHYREILFLRHSLCLAFWVMQSVSRLILGTHTVNTNFLFMWAFLYCLYKILFSVSSWIMSISLGRQGFLSDTL